MTALFHRFRRFTRIGVAAYCVFIFSYADIVAAEDAVSLADVVRRVQDSNPRLQAQPFALAGADARGAQAAQRPVFELGTEVENILGTGGTPAFDALEATLTLGTVIELGGKRTKRIVASQRTRDTLLIEQRAERLDILADAARKFIELVKQQDLLEIAVRNRELAERTMKTVNTRVERGASSPVEGSNAAVVLTQAELEVLDRTAAVNGAWAILAATWGNQPGRNAEIASAALYQLPPARPFDALLKELEENPDILRFASENRATAARLRMIQANQSPDISVAAGVRRDQAARGQSFLLSLSIPLGTAGRNSPYEREVRAHLNQLPYEEAAARTTLSATLFELHQQLVAAEQSFEVLQSRALPQAERAARLTEEGFNVGRFSLLDLTTTQQRLLEVRQQVAVVAATYHLVFLEIERLTGRAFGASPVAIPAITGAKP